MSLEIQNLVDRTDFNGYVIIDWDSVFGKTKCPNEAVAIALERTRTGGEGLAEFVKVYSIGTKGAYAEVPGERYYEEFDWNRALRQLMY